MPSMFTVNPARHRSGAGSLDSGAGPLGRAASPVPMATRQVRTASSTSMASSPPAGPRRTRAASIAAIFVAVSALAGSMLLGPAAAAQSADIDWRSALVLRFDPAGAGDGTYLKGVVDVLESRWIGEAGITAVAIGPIFPAEETIAQAAPASDVMKPTTFGAIDPSLGSAGDFGAVVAAAGEANLPMILHLRAPGTPEAYARLAAWASETGTRHFVLYEAGEEDVRTLRAALQAAGVERSWIAGAGPDDGTPFDARIERMAAIELEDDGAMTAAYAQAAQRRDTSPKPVITSAAILATASAESIARLLMHPGPLEIVVDPANSREGAPWQRIAAFRVRHPAIGGGEHVDLANNAFAFGRTSADPLVDDRVVVVFGASNNTTVNVSRVFPDNTLLSDALTGRTAFVSFGMASFDAGSDGILLIEEIR